MRPVAREQPGLGPSAPPQTPLSAGGLRRVHRPPTECGTFDIARTIGLRGLQISYKATQDGRGLSHREHASAGVSANSSGYPERHPAALGLDEQALADLTGFLLGFN